MQKRFVTLDAAERTTLQAGRHHHPKHQFRARCQCLLLSADGQGVAALMAVLGVSRTTVFAWFERWETGGLAGLANAPGQGAARAHGGRQAARTPGRRAEPPATKGGDGHLAPGVELRIIAQDAEAFF